MKVKFIVEGGQMQPGPVVAQQLGPTGINLGKVISDINNVTGEFSGMKVPVEIDIDLKTKSFSVNVLSPPVAELIKKEIGAEKGSGKPNTVKVGNIAFERLIAIAKMKMNDLLARELKSAVKLVAGSCASLGVLIDNKEAKEIELEIEKGKYDREIKGEITEVPQEKKEKLEKFFAVRKAKQEKDLKALEEARAAEEAAKQAALAQAATTGAGGVTAESSVSKEDKKKK